MIVGYLKKQNKPVGFAERIQFYLGIVKITQCNMGYILEIPFNISEEKLIKNVIKIIKKYKIDNIVFSKELINTEFSLKVIDNLDKINVFNGRKLMNLMMYDIFSYILDSQKINANNVDCFFLIKKDEYLDIKFLSKFIKDCKSITIVTNDIKKFKKMQENLYDNESILIGVSNSKNKALKRAKYIFNVNMNENEIKKYKINRNAIIINIENGVYNNKIGFEGINVNYMTILLPDEIMEQFETINKNKDFDLNVLYEVYLMWKVNPKTKYINNFDCKKMENIYEKIIEQDNVKIAGLIGNNGKINEREFVEKSVLNTLTK